MASFRSLALGVAVSLAVSACDSTTQTQTPAFVCPGAASQTDAGADAAIDAGVVVTDGDASAPFNVLLFSRTAGFRHESIPTAIAQLMDLQATGGYVAEATEDPTQFSPGNLARFQVVVFLLTTGDVLDDDQQSAFEAWIGAGGGYVGVHSAADTEYDWPFYGALVGAYFLSHPAIQQASVDVEVTDHPATVGLPSPWVRTDEWYNFQTNPRPNVTVLATVDESTYTVARAGLGRDTVTRTLYLGHLTQRDFGPYTPCTPACPGPQLGYNFGVSTHHKEEEVPEGAVDRIARRRFAEEVARKHAVDPGDVEHVLSNLTLPPLERLQRSLRRARLGRPAGK